LQSLRKIFYPPTIGLFLYVLFILTLLVLLPLLLIGATKLVFANLGFSFTDALLIIVLSLLGSTVNIPLFKIKTREPVLKIDYYTFFGVTYPIPTVINAQAETLVAINVGGALIPVILSLYLWYHFYVYTLRIALAVLLVSVIVNRLAKPVKGMGIVVPAFIPPILAALFSLLLSLGKPELAFSLAYISGSLGTLIGADLLNLKKLGELSAKIVSIGGAGTFDGVFMSGLLAVVLLVIFGFTP
jgi:uncharacterized membrane protein